MAKVAKEAKAEVVSAPVLIIWNKPRVRLIHYPVDNRGRKISKYIRLNPGTNELSANTWKGLQTRDRIKSDLQKGDIKVVVSAEGTALPKIPANLESMTDEAAIELVKNTMDETQLKAWSKDKRKIIKEEIANQIERLAAAVPGKDE